MIVHDDEHQTRPMWIPGFESDPGSPQQPATSSRQRRRPLAIGALIAAAAALAGGILALTALSGTSAPSPANGVSGTQPAITGQSAGVSPAPASPASSPASGSSASPTSTRHDD